MRFNFYVSLLCGVLASLSASAQDVSQEGARQKPAYFTAATFADGAQFIFRLEHPTAIREARRILSGKETKEVHISGTIVKAPADYNPGWSFHLDPDSIIFFGAAAEVCDAATVMVEQDLDDVGGSFLPGARWCPWSSRITSELGSVRDPIITVVSAASQSEVAISPSSLASIQGEKLTAGAESAQGPELPTKLAGVQVEFRRAGNSQRPKARLLLASPDVVNFVVPEDLSPGTLYTVKLIRDNQRDLEATTPVESAAPGVFFGETVEGRYAAASLLRVRSDGSRSDESTLSLDADGNYVPVAIDFGAPDDRLYLSLYGTGIGNAEVSVRVGSDNVPILYSGPQGSMEGLDQINIELPRSLASKSEAEITVSAKNGKGRTVRSAPVSVLVKRQ